ncbi:signal protein [Bacteroides sp. 214]|uniref:outer membrane beta-barrel family protein n=1 Tax=Bacteroides sp. 214 TaxID=2302935 RepID=UPI0013D40489|nr:outer membrane beta-barrel family protein [Bacteroides sp. 214]NDW12830.1 signal protein [Bacteroides sp. 214]
MERFIILITLFAVTTTYSFSQSNDNDTTSLSLDSLYMELPEVLIKGERPIVKAKEGKLIYNLPQLMEGKPVDNAYEAIKELPGIVDMGSGLTLLGKKVNVVIDGKVSTMSEEQLINLLKTIPVSTIEKAEVMAAAPARYQVRGPMINLILNTYSATAPYLQGEVYTSWVKDYYAQYQERINLQFTASKFSADLLYGYHHGKQRSGINKEARHIVDGITYPIQNSEIAKGWGNTHTIRYGMNYSFDEKNVLSLVYNTEIHNGRRKGTTTGTEESFVRNVYDDQLHNLKLDYTSSFGLTAGSEFTFYQSPSTQDLHSLLNNEEINVYYEEKQRINRWRFYATQEHALKNNWAINYGANYTTTLDNSYQYYYDSQTGMFDPDKSMQARKQEHTFNVFAGFSTTFGEKLSLDASFAAERYKTTVWDEWAFYPTLNLSYYAAPEHIFQFSFSGDKQYPPFWSVNNAIAYTSAYTEIHGNPELKPNSEYQATLTYILKSKYMFSAFYNYEPDYSTQVPYQRPDRLVEVYKNLNFDYKKQLGLQASIPLKVKNILNSRFTVVGYYIREKDKDFWDIPFDRSDYSFILVMDNSLKLFTKPNITLNVSGFYQNGSIQGIYDLGRSGNLDASLMWSFLKDKARLTLKGADLFDTSSITPRIDFKGQYTVNRFIQQNRSLQISFSYRFGSYEEKQYEEVDRSRFK